MPTVYLFACTGRFGSFEELRAWIDPTYKTDSAGEVERIDAPLVREVGLDDFEPMCIEAILAEAPAPLPELLEGVYAPNTVGKPEASTVSFVGSYSYEE